jgi:cytochrome c oxidase subunit 1
MSAVPGHVGQARPAGGRYRVFNMGTALVLGIGLGILGAYIGGHVITWLDMDSQLDTDQPDVAVLFGYCFGTIGWLIGLGFFNYPWRRLTGHPPTIAEEEADPNPGIGRYFRMSTDHKVVGIQYFFGIMLFFFIAGLQAMLIRTELLYPSEHAFPPGEYITLVGEHGTMMIMMMSSVVIGPFANYFVPVMIGAKRMALPRVEALSFWLLPAAEVILLSSLALGGFPTGWTGYDPLADQAVLGMDGYLMSFCLIGISMALVGLNMVATVLSMRAPGMTWSRLPIFVWGALSTGILMLLAPPYLFLAMVLTMLDRTISTSFFLPSGGGSAYLYENLFWFFGHPEVYILALPGFGVVLEILPVFARKPLWGYKLAVAGLLGVALLSWGVWQHHLFVSGIDASLRPFFILNTELISIPTGFIFLNGIGTIWRGQLKFTLPVLFCLAFYFNFVIGGLSGIFLSDAPSDVTTHGSFFVMAHFHYTIMGGVVFAFFAGCYYWFPKMFGVYLNERIGKWQFWILFVSFNCTFFPLFAVGFLGMPRRVSMYAPSLQTLNDFVTASAYMIGVSMVIFAVNLVYSLVVRPQRAPANPWNALSLEWQLPSPVPAHNFDEIPVIQTGPYEYGVPGAPAVANLTPSRPAVAGGD